MPADRPRLLSRQSLLAATATAAVLGIGMLVLQRWVAQTKWVAIVLVAAWFVIVAIGLTVVLWRRAELRLAAWLTYLLVLVATIGVGYWTGFRDKEVNEDVVVATAQAEGAERTSSLGVGGGSASARPVELASGTFTGEDGHSGTGTATVIEQPDGSRVVTFTDFDVDNAVDVDVYLVPGDGSDVSDRVELGDLKGNIGNQQYDIPAGTDLNTYSTVVLYCIPFSVRIAIAPLDV